MKIEVPAVVTVVAKCIVTMLARVDENDPKVKERSMMTKVTGILTLSVGPSACQAVSNGIE